MNTVIDTMSNKKKVELLKRSFAKQPENRWLRNTQEIGRICQFAKLYPSIIHLSEESVLSCHFLNWPWLLIWSGVAALIIAFSINHYYYYYQETPLSVAIVPRFCAVLQLRIMSIIPSLSSINTHSSIALTLIIAFQIDPDE